MSVDKLLDDLAQVLEEVKASAADKKGDEGQMVALYGMFPWQLIWKTLTIRNGSDKRWTLCGWESGGNLLGYLVRVEYKPLALSSRTCLCTYTPFIHSHEVLTF